VGQAKDFAGKIPSLMSLVEFGWLLYRVVTNCKRLHECEIFGAFYHDSRKFSSPKFESRK
jgi:hypothetical protein